MSNYNKIVDYASKDSLASGNPLKVIKGTEINDEFEAIENAFPTKADLASPAFTGTPTVNPNPVASSNTNSVATTSFVKTVITSGGYITTDGIADNAITLPKMADNSVSSAEIVDNSVTADELNVDGDGEVGQSLVSDGDGSMSWSHIGLRHLEENDIGQVAFLGVEGDLDSIPDGIPYGTVVDTATCGYSLYPAGVFADSGVNGNGSVVIWDADSTLGAGSVGATAVTGTWKCLGVIYKMASANWRSATLFVRIA